MRAFIFSFGSVALIAALTSPVAANSTNHTFTGSFPATLNGALPSQTSVLMESLMLPAGSDVTITSTSYANGGFQPNLFLYNSGGITVGAAVPFGLADPISGIIGDSRLKANDLAAGEYTLIVTGLLMNQSLTAMNLSDGFAGATERSFASTARTDAASGDRTLNYSVNISLVPEPASIVLIGTMVGPIWLACKRSRRAGRKR